MNPESITTTIEETVNVEQQCRELSEVLASFERYADSSYDLRDRDKEQCRILIKWAFLAGQVKGLQHP